jgi:hypothetical protein
LQVCAILEENGMNVFGQEGRSLGNSREIDKGIMLGAMDLITATNGLSQSAINFDA